MEERFIYYSSGCRVSIEELFQVILELMGYTVVLTYPKMDRVHFIGDFGRITAHCGSDVSLLVLLRVRFLSNTSLMICSSSPAL